MLTRICLIFILVFSFIPLNLSAYEIPYLYGIHDHQPQPTEYLNRIKNKVSGGWVTATLAIGSNPNDHGGVDFSWYANNGHTVIGRLNNGYFPNGTIPTPDKYADFAQRAANFVANSTGCEIWVIGNETNLASEWPPHDDHMAYVSPQEYAECFRLVYDAIKAVRPNHKVLPQALAPWSGPWGPGTLGHYTHDGNPLNWVDYKYQMLSAIRDSGGIDGIAVHINSRGYSYEDIHSDHKINAGGKELYWSFYVYKDWVEHGIPTDLYHLPLYATECNGYFYWKGGHPEDPSKHYEPSWMQEIYKEIDKYNREVAVPEGKPIYRCINMYRWCAHCDGWNIDGDANPYKAQILNDLDEALEFAYAWPESPLTPPPPAWRDDFLGSELNQTPPEPDWSTFNANNGTIQVSDGQLKLVGQSEQASVALIRNDKYMLYRDFFITSKLQLANSDATVGGESNAEIRFRTNASGTGYSLSFKANDSPNVINLRRSDTWQVVQNKQVNYNLPSGTTLYVSILAEGERLIIKVGTSEGASDVVNWDFEDSTFPGKGCFWLMNYQMSDLRFDYFSYQPIPAGMEGVVRDTLGNLIEGALVTVSPGEISATTNESGYYLIDELAPGIYSATASKANYNSQTINNIEVISTQRTNVNFTIRDNTPPTTPEVWHDKPYQTDTDKMTFHFYSEDPESGILMYRTAISGSQSTTDLIPGGDWVIIDAPAESHTRTGLALENGKTYYALAQARNRVNLNSLIGISDGVKVAKAITSIAAAKSEQDNITIAIEDRVVTAEFDDCIYIADPDRTSGIRVNAVGIDEGMIVDVAGEITTLAGERQISGYAVIPKSVGTPLVPMGMTNKNIGGAALNEHTPGISDAVGLHNIGLLITTWGKVIDKNTDHFIISDGSANGLKTIIPAGVSMPDVGTLAAVTGISSIEENNGITSSILKVRKQSDIAIIIE